MSVDQLHVSSDIAQDTQDLKQHIQSIPNVKIYIFEFVIKTARDESSAHKLLRCHVNLALGVEMSGDIVQMDRPDLKEQ